MSYKPPNRAPGSAPPAGPAALRRANLSLVLRELRDHKVLSRADIAETTGLHRATVSNLMAELLERRLVREVGVRHAGAVGRPRRAVALHGAHVGALGMEINVDYIAVHGTDLSGRVLVERRIVHDAVGSGPDGSVRRLAAVAGQAVEAMRRAGATPAGIAVAVPGLVDVTRGVVTLAPNLSWHELPLAERLTSVLGPLRLPVRVDNDANLAALAEYTSGVAAGTPYLVYLTGEVGVGGGIILDGRLLRGADGFSGEVGHLQVDPDGAQCGCGRAGCWETKVGLAALVRAAMPEQAYGLPGRPVPDPGERVSDIADGLAAGDPRMTAAVAQVGEWLGLGGSILANLFNPRVIVIGGYFASLARWLLPHAQDQLDRLVVAAPAARCRLVASTLGFGAASRGAASMVVSDVIDDPTAIIGTSPRPAPV
ncbi:ROK family protein [Nonomuraea wenchangensis]|uniref:Sugar kinase of the NBD/HSP70 family, may contain an N-terminal HTH domain n=1 Tax=Nonomuraea wenchangensis TaxID=568860 RepID=A0A1I0LW84_9ACTN|nr:ROK family transcriptional regulator [Nonomuraea wenchangensis]SEU47229.1 Sugar kinase of the NBD/HSP70 family, may contain an N-terminal HTH domain [Nonomuraea wenchangensis]